MGKITSPTMSYTCNCSLLHELFQSESHMDSRNNSFMHALQITMFPFPDRARDYVQELHPCCCIINRAAESPGARQNQQKQTLEGRPELLHAHMTVSLSLEFVQQNSTSIQNRETSLLELSICPYVLYCMIQ